MKNILIIACALIVAVGCGSNEANGIETKASQVKLDMPKEQQDALAAKIKAWDPKKDPK